MDEKNKYIVIMNEGVTYDCLDANDIVSAIIEEYHRSDICLAELLAQIEIRGVSIETVVEIYAELFRIIEGDVTIRITNPDNVEYDDNDVIVL